MPTEIEYALMAGAVYVSTRGRNNLIPLPSGTGWQELGSPDVDSRIGYEAQAYIRGNEIVISFAGTGTLIDWLANIQLAGGTSTSQLEAAALYYESIKATYGSGKTISFTGHSLGGGLAALMGVFFNKQAVTFDSAPFRQAANNLVRDALRSFLTISDGDLNAFTRVLNQIRGENQVTKKAVRGEFLSLVTNGARIGLPGASVILNHGTPLLQSNPVSLHSVALLTGFITNDQFRRITFDLPKLLPKIFDGNLFARPTEENERNLMDHLIRHQFGVPGEITADGMLNRFVTDLQIVTRLKPSQSQDVLVSGLITLALQHYYQQQLTQLALFKSLSGGVQFDLTKPLGDVDTGLAAMNGYGELRGYARDTALISGNGALDALNTFTGEKRRWSVSLGAGNLNVTAIDGVSDLMLGDSGQDSLRAGGGDDLLIGADGIDTLIGGLGTDILIGGDGVDTYEINTGDGNDRVIDSGRSYLRRDGNLFAGVFVRDGNTNTYKFVTDDNITIAINSPAKLDFGNGDSITFDDLTTAGLVNQNLAGIQLREPIASPTQVVAGDQDPNAPDDFLAGVPDVNLSARWQGLTGNDVINPKSLGNDWIEGGAGEDLVVGSGGADRLSGGNGTDFLFGGALQPWSAVCLRERSATSSRHSRPGFVSVLVAATLSAVTLMGGYITSAAASEKYQIINTGIEGGGCWYDNTRFVVIKRKQIPQPQLNETEGLYYFDVAKPMELKRIDLAPLDVELQKRIWEIKCTDGSVVFAVSDSLYQAKIGQPLKQIVVGRQGAFSPSSVNFTSNRLLARSGKISPESSIGRALEDCGLTYFDSRFKTVCWHNTHSLQKTWVLPNSVLAEYRWQETIRVRGEDGQVKTIKNPEAPLKGENGKTIVGALLLRDLNGNVLANLSDNLSYKIFGYTITVDPKGRYLYGPCHDLNSVDGVHNAVCRYLLDDRPQQWEKVFEFNVPNKAKAGIQYLDATRAGDIYFVLPGARFPNNGIWKFHSGTKTVIQITRPDRFLSDGSPGASPDGSKVVFVRRTKDGSMLHVAFQRGASK